MVAAGKGKKPKKEAGAGSDGGAAVAEGDDSALAQDVASQLRELGLAPSVGGDHEFADFAPPSSAAQKQAAPAKAKAKGASPEPAQDAPKQQQPRKEKGGKQGTPPPHQQQAKGKPSEQPQQQQQQQGKEPPKREWNAGAGPRPGGQAGKSLLAQDQPSVWYVASAALPSLQEPPAADGKGKAKPPQPLTDEQVDELRQRCEELIANEVAAFDKELKKRNAADYKWIMQVKRSGTTSDRVAAITLQVQESVVANLSSLDTLISWVQKRKGGREVVRQAIEALQELFCTVLLPDRKLLHFEQRPLHLLPPGKEASKHLLFWYLEDQIKVRYNLLIDALAACSRDNLDFLKERATKAIYELLVKKPEGEAKLLAALVNKLGDPNRRIASKSGFLLSQLLLQHPVMKPIVAREVERFLFRPGLQTRARYYAILFLNQLPLSHKEQEGGPALARRLVDLYFTMFRMIVEGQVGSAAEASKVQAERYKKERAAYLRQKKRMEEQQQQGAGAGKKKGGKGATAGIKAKGNKLKPPKKPKPAVPEEMDARLLSALIVGIRRAFPYVAQEEVEPLIERNSQQLFRLVHVAPFPVAVQALMLMWQLFSTQATISERFYRALYAVLSSDGPASSSKAPMFLALLFKAMRTDVSPKRCAAFAKRLLQVALPGPAHFVCGALLLVSEVLKAQPALWAGMLQPEDTSATHARGKADLARATGGAGGGRGASSGDEDDYEVFKDVDDEDEESQQQQQQHQGQEQKQGQKEGSEERERGQQQSVGGGELRGSAVTNGALPGGAVWPKPGYYDMLKREPLYAKAESACWWELLALAAHSHPSVSAMARTLMSGQHVVYDGDPMHDHSLVAFLDKFIVKKPKVGTRGASVMQPPAVPPSERSVAQLGHEAFAALAESEVQPDEVFFHRFHSLQTVKARRAAAQIAKKAKKAKKGQDEASEDESSDEAGSDGVDDEDADAFMDAQEAGVDDGMGDPDMGGFDYAALERELNKEDGKEEGGSYSGSDAEDDEESEGGSDEGEGSGEEAGGSDGEEGGSDASEEEEQAAAVDGEPASDGYDEELEGLGLKGLMNLPSPSESDEDDPPHKHASASKGTKRKSKGEGADAAPQPTKSSSKKRHRGADGAASASAESGSEGEEADADARLGARTFEGMEDDESDEGGEGGEHGSPPPASSGDEEGSEEGPMLMSEMLGSASEGSEEDAAGAGGSSDEEAPAGKKQGKGKAEKGGGKKKKSKDVFASADDYADLIAEIERQQQQQQQEGGEGEEEAGGGRKNRSRGGKPGKQKGPAGGKPKQGGGVGKKRGKSKK